MKMLKDRREVHVRFRGLSECDPMSLADLAYLTSLPFHCG